MARTLLELAQQAMSEIGIPQPEQLVGSPNAQERQLLSLAKREAREFSGVANKDGGWQQLHKEYTFNTAVLNTTGNTTAGSAIVVGIPSTAGLVAGTWGANINGFPQDSMIVSVDSANQVTLNNTCSVTQTGVALSFGQSAYALPNDLEYFLDKTFWDNKYKWALMGPITAQEKQILKYGVVASGPRNKFYIRANLMWITPIPQQAQLIAYDYMSNAYCQSEMGVTQSSWQADTDTYLLDEEIFIQGLKWRFLRAKGLDYAEERNSYEMDVQRVISRDGGSADLPMGTAGFAVQFLDGNNVPETGYGGQW